jgi:hypothetical protein
MLRLASRFGDPSPASITAVTANCEEAIHAASPGSIPTSHRDRPSYFVLMTGNFTLGRPNPVAGRLLTGRYLTVLIDPATFRCTDRGLGDRPPPIPLQNFGLVSDLTEPR